MISRIAQKELAEILRDGRFRILSVAVLAVSVVSLMVGWKQYADVSRQHEEAQASTRRQWLNQSKRNPHSAAHYGVYAFKPKSPLAIVDTGIQQELRARVEQRRVELMQKYGATSIDALPVAFSGVSLQEGEKHGDEVFDRHYGRLFDTYDRQNTTFQLGGIVAPMLAIRSISMGLAGTDFPQHRHFAAAAENYRRLIQRTMNNDIMEHPTRGGPYLASRELWEKVPEFEYSAPSTSWVMSNVGLSALILGVWLAV